MKRCPACQEWVEDGWRFCQACGGALPEADGRGGENAPAGTRGGEEVGRPAVGGCGGVGRPAPSVLRPAPSALSAPGAGGESTRVQDQVCLEMSWGGGGEGSLRGYLRLRVTNRRAEACQYELSVECPQLTLDEPGPSRRVRLDPGQVTELTPFYFRSAVRQFVVCVGLHGDTASWRVTQHVELSEGRGPEQIVIHGAQADVLVGDHVYNLNVAPATAHRSDAELPFVPLDLQPWIREESLVPKRLAAGFSVPAGAGSPRLALVVDHGSHRSCTGLLAGCRFTLGRKRETNDLVLRCPLAEDPTGQKTERLSRQQGVIEFTAGGVVWRELETLNRTMLTYPGCPARDAACGRHDLLRHGTAISPGRALSLTAHVSRVNHVHAAGEEPYRRFARRVLGIEIESPVGPDQSLRLVRHDALAEAELYILFQQSIYVGRDPDCPLHVDHPSVAWRHAHVVWLGGRFWLEPVQAIHPTYADRTPLAPHELVPLTPALPLRLGDVELTVAEFQQRLE